MRACIRLPGSPQSVLHPYHTPDAPALHVMLPDSDNTPAIPTEHPIYPLITSLVCHQLAAPPAGVCLRLRSVLPAVVPKATIDKDGNTLITKNKVWCGPDRCMTNAKPDRQMPAPTANPHASEGLQETYFRRGIAGSPDGGHHRRSFPLREYVCQNCFAFSAIGAGARLLARVAFGWTEKGCGMRTPNEPQCPSQLPVTLVS